MIITGSIWIVRPMFLTQQVKNNTLTYDGQPELPLGGWYPFKVDTQTTYNVVFAQQVISMILFGLSSHGCNLLFLMTAMYISKLMSFLNHQLALVPNEKNIKQRICELGKFQEEVFR